MICDECETVAHCMKNGCVPKHQALERMAENARELGLDYEQPAQQCKWPTCQSEEYQQALAEQIKRELVGEQPAQRKPLTDEQIIKCWGQVGGIRHGYVTFARAIEAKLRSKNT